MINRMSSICVAYLTTSYETVALTGPMPHIVFGVFTTANLLFADEKKKFEIYSLQILGCTERHFYNRFKRDNELIMCRNVVHYCSIRAHFYTTQCTKFSKG